MYNYCFENIKVIPSPYNPPECQLAKCDPKRGEQMAQDVYAWMLNNEDTFFYMYAFVKDLSSKNIKGRLRDRVINHCLSKRKKKDASTFTLKHGLFSGIVRYMALYDSTLRGHPITFGVSDIDVFGLYEVDYLHLNLSKTL